MGARPCAEEYAELFVFELYPYASVYVGREGMLGGEAGDRVGGFWRALGQVPPVEADHLSVMLALYARLCELEEEGGNEALRAGWRGARRAFLWEHLLSWLPVYLVKLAEVAPPFYRRWGEVLLKALLAEIEVAGRQESLPLHLREAGGLVDPRAGEGDFWQALLTPARSGMILTRADLRRAGRALGCGVRMGERKFVLKSLAAQNARGTFDWLTEEAAAWEKRHRSFEQTLGAVADAWAAKAKDAGRLLGDLKQEASKVI
ncbi:MAG TPA: molecular chaperone TorD family protein [Pyrinomonadaceae bacterium]